MGFIFFLLLGVFGIAAIVFLVLTIMKKPYMWIGLIVSFVIAIFAGGGFILSLLFSFADDVSDSSTPVIANVDDENAEDEEEVKKKKKEDSKEKYVELNDEFEVNGLTIVIEDIDISEKYVVINVSATNHSDNSKSFYPDQGEIVIGNKQLSSNFLMNKGDTWGDIHAGVEKSSTLKYVADDDGLKPSEITEIKLMLGNVYDEETYDAESFEETISLD